MALKPIRRSKALMPLSREHHFDLLLAWKIRRGLANGAELKRIADYVAYMDKNLVEAHFRDEEKLLFAPFLPGDELCERAMAEHAAIREITAKIRQEQYRDRDLFEQLADAIEAHVRFEERELFPYLEQKISRERLDELEGIIEAAHANFIDIWEDSFWER